MLWRFGSVLLLAHLMTATPLVRRWNDFTEKHSWIQIPKGWELFSEAPSDYTFDLRIGLKQNGMEKLIENLMETSDPSHVRYVNPYLSGVSVIQQSQQVWTAPYSTRDRATCSAPARVY